MKLLPVLFACFALTFADHASGADAGAAPATLGKEGDLTTIILKPEAEQRLRLKVVSVERRAVPGSRLFAGEIVLPLSGTGRTVTPVLGGTLDEVLRLSDLQVTAEGRVLQTQVQVDAAKVALDRAQKMLKVEAGSVRTVDEAKASLALAEAALITAKAQREILGSSVGGEKTAQTRWVRAALYSGEVGSLDAKTPARIRALGRTGESVEVKPVAGPPTANSAAATVDWYFEVPAGRVFRPGERVAVEISTVDSQAENLVVPFNAVLHDIHGGQWVYENSAPHTYVRRRVTVARVVGTDAVLAGGPPVGSKVVTDGAAELFGTEFMTGK